MDFVVTDLSKSVLELTVFDSDLFSPNGESHVGRDQQQHPSSPLSDFLGCARISIPDLLKEEPHGPWTKRLLLEDVSKGEIELRLALKLSPE